jgi:hypothetical protein
VNIRKAGSDKSMLMTLVELNKMFQIYAKLLQYRLRNYRALMCEFSLHDRHVVRDSHNPRMQRG